MNSDQDRDFKTFLHRISGRYSKFKPKWKSVQLQVTAQKKGSAFNRWKLCKVWDKSLHATITNEYASAVAASQVVPEANESGTS